MNIFQNNGSRHSKFKPKERDFANATFSSKLAVEKKEIMKKFKNSYIFFRFIFRIKSNYKDDQGLNFQTRIHNLTIILITKKYHTS